MTVDEALSAFSDEAVQSPGDKARDWLDEIEFTVKCEVADTHEGEHPVYIPVRERAGDDRLFVPEPYSSLYVDYLLMKNDLLLHDTARYANSAAVFAAAYEAFTSYYNRTRMPISGGGITL